jgi:serine/threonine protein phosphatase PrpC
LAKIELRFRSWGLFTFNELRGVSCCFVAAVVYNVRCNGRRNFRLAREVVKLAVDCLHVKPGVEVAALSDVGCQRENNEDSYLYWEPAGDEEFRLKGRLAVIADGMGGHEGGQEASRMAVETVREAYDERFRGDPQAALSESLHAAHAGILSFAEKHPAFQGMGTTCTALVLRGRQLYFAHVGDSRLYLVRNGKILRLTRDHSYVGRLVESGLVRAEDAERHPQRHILTAALGSGLEITVDGPQQTVPLQTGDDLLLCTDGLWSVVSEAELQDALSANAPAECCSALVKLARQRGGPDNITLQVLRVGSESRV